MGERSESYLPNIYISITNDTNNRILRAVDYVREEITQEMYDRLNTRYKKLARDNQALIAQNAMLITRLCEAPRETALDIALKSNYMPIDLNI
jgi:hypothetical protein